MNRHLCIALTYFSNHALQSFTRTAFGKVRSPGIHHILDFLSPKNTSRKLLNKVSFDLFRISMSQTINILINRAYRFLELCYGYCSLQFFFSRLHKRTVESTTNRKQQGTFGSVFFQFGASSLNSFLFTANNQLTRAIIISRYNDHSCLLAHFFTNSFNFFIR